MLTMGGSESVSQRPLGWVAGQPNKHMTITTTSPRGRSLSERLSHEIEAAVAER